MNEIIITVLMPLKHYHPIFLNKAINSIISQSRPYWRLLITVEKRDLKKFRKLLEKELNDSRIEIIGNRGRKLAGSINTGMRYAKTDFVAILLADDKWVLEAVDVLTRYINKYPDIDFFHSSRVYIDENDNLISSVYFSNENFVLDDWKIDSPIKHLLCWRREKGLAIGGLDESLDSVGPDDYDFPWSMAEDGATFKAVKECLYYYRDHRACYRLTTHLPMSVHKREITRIYKKHGVGENDITKKLKFGERTFLRQCLFKNKFDKLIKVIWGFDAKKSWRKKYLST